MEGREDRMIEIRELTKRFDGEKAVDNITTTIHEGQIFGFVGSNGAGKSTLLRLLSGVLKADQGMIQIDGQPVYENMEIKKDICLLSDTAYFLPNATVKIMKEYYQMIYEKFDEKKFEELLEKFHVDASRKISTCSKGMKKQISMLLGICAGTKYLFCDETFDGLDPVMRQAVKSLFASEVINRDFTPLIASHNLREIEDICDTVGLLHKGGILFTKDMEDMKFHMHKVQCVIANPVDEEQLLAELQVLSHEKRGSILSFTARGTREEILDRVKERDPVFMEALPLSLEEIFISEMEVKGYDVKHFVL